MATTISQRISRTVCQSVQETHLTLILYFSQLLVRFDVAGLEPDLLLRTEVKQFNCMKSEKLTSYGHHTAACVLFNEKCFNTFS